jgi:hypothetical protein
MTSASRFPSNSNRATILASSVPTSQDNQDGLPRQKNNHSFAAGPSLPVVSQGDTTNVPELRELPEDSHPSFATMQNPTKLFHFVTARNWPAVIKRCMGEDKKEVSTWIVEKNNDGSTRWKLLPIHKVGSSCRSSRQHTFYIHFPTKFNHYIIYRRVKTMLLRMLSRL